MKRILRIVNRFNLGGPTYNAALLTKYLYPEYETLLIGGIHEDYEESSEFILHDLNIKATIIPEMSRSIKPFNDYVALKKIKQIIQEFRPDIVHTHASKAGMLGRLAALQLNVPVIVHTFHGHVFHSYFNKLKTKTYITIERYLAERSDAIIAISTKQKYELSYIYNIAPENKIQVIPLGLDLSRFQQDINEKRQKFRQQYNIDDNEIAIAIVGRLVPIKNHKLFIKAIAEIKQQTNTKIRAFIVGDGLLRKELETLAYDLNLTFNNGSFYHKPDLHFTSWIKDIDTVYAGVDIVALTSLNEGTPVSLIEAQAAGKPVVTTDVGGIRDIVLEGKSALISSPNNEKEFINNLLSLIIDDTKRQKMQNMAVNFVYSNFNYQRLISDISKLYDELLKTKKTKFVKNYFVF